MRALLTLTTLPPHTPTPTHTHTHPPPHTHTHPTESGRVECLLPGAGETGQADHDTLHTAEAQVTSAESAPGWTFYRGMVERSLRVNQGRHGECLQGNVVCWEIVASLCSYYSLS